MRGVARLFRPVAFQIACLLPAVILARPLEEAIALEPSQPKLIHTVVPSECSEYQNWQVFVHFIDLIP